MNGFLWLRLYIYFIENVKTVSDAAFHFTSSHQTLLGSRCVFVQCRCVTVASLRGLGLEWRAKKAFLNLAACLLVQFSNTRSFAPTVSTHSPSIYNLPITFPFPYPPTHSPSPHHSPLTPSTFAIVLLSPPPPPLHPHSLFSSEPPAVPPSLPAPSSPALFCPLPLFLLSLPPLKPSGSA